MQADGLRKIRWRKLKHWIIVLILLLTILFAIRLRISDVTVEGTETYTDEEAIALVFSDYWDSNTLVCFLNNLLGKKKDLPFIADYDIILSGLTSCELVVYEKSPVGCVDYMGSYMYFDNDGIIIESSDDRLPGVPVIEGIDFGHIVLGEELPVENTGVFTDVMTVTQQLDMYDIGCEKIYYSELMEITVTLEGGDIRVELGTNDNISSRISLLNDMLPEIEKTGLKGTLYLNNYSENSEGDAVTFRIDES